MTASRRKSLQEFEDKFCRDVISASKPVKDLVEAYGIGSVTLRNWLNKHLEANGGTKTKLSVPEQARLKELEREVQELKAEARFLKKSAVYCAQKQR